MSAPWVTHFGASEAPFSKELPDAELWLPPSKHATVEALLGAVAERASVVLVGEPGVGKTCVLRALRHRLATQDVRLTYCHNVTLGRRDFYRQLCRALGLRTVMTAGAVFDAVTTYVEELGRERRAHPVFLLDEAHLLHQDVLDHLHILLNYEWDSRALLSLVLVGLPELEDRLDRRRNRALYTRLHHRLRIEPLTVEDTAAYVATRLGRVGVAHALFAADALATLHGAAQGALREIDRLATAALRETARRRRKLVDGDTMERVLARADRDTAE
jgi:type II secretory pathway predicted ATPase ExeA